MQNTMQLHGRKTITFFLNRSTIFFLSSAGFASGLIGNDACRKAYVWQKDMQIKLEKNPHSKPIKLFGRLERLHHYWPDVTGSQARGVRAQCKLPTEVGLTHIKTLLSRATKQPHTKRKHNKFKSGYFNTRTQPTLTLHTRYCHII